MSATANSSLFAPARRLCVTDVVRSVRATSIDAICSSSGLVSIRFATRAGIEIVEVPLWSFLDKAQAPRDHNGNPFRPATVNPRAIEEADAATIPITKGGPSDERRTSPTNRYGRYGFPVGKRQALRAAYDLHISGGDNRTQVVIAASLGVTEQSLSRYWKRFRTADAVQPYRKPCGKIL